MRDQLTISADDAYHTRVVRLSGELDMATAPQLDAVLADTDGAYRVVVDMWDLSFIDSSGLRVLVAAHRRVRRRGTDTGPQRDTPGRVDRDAGLGPRQGAAH